MGHNGVILSYTISTDFLRVDGSSMDHRILGRHRASQRAHSDLHYHQVPPPNVVVYGQLIPSHPFDLYLKLNHCPI